MVETATLRGELVRMAAVAQQPQQQEGEKPNVIQKYGPRRQISTIVYMGLAGAVLGLSTLSFYGRPQDNLTNITIGFGVGVIVGTVYMTYQAATNPNEFYRPTHYQFNPRRQLVQVDEFRASDLYMERVKPSLSYAWKF